MLIYRVDWGVFIRYNPPRLNPHIPSASSPEIQRQIQSTWCFVCVVGLLKMSVEHKGSRRWFLATGGALGAALACVPGQVQAEVENEDTGKHEDGMGGANVV